jgi:hypothetical protein
VHALALCDSDSDSSFSRRFLFLFLFFVFVPSCFWTTTRLCSKHFDHTLFDVAGLCDHLLVAAKASSTLIGQRLTTATLVAAITALKSDVTAAGASTDPRWSAAYKLDLAAGFLYKVRNAENNMPAHSHARSSSRAQDARM